MVTDLGGEGKKSAFTSTGNEGVYLSGIKLSPRLLVKQTDEKKKEQGRSIGLFKKEHFHHRSLGETKNFYIQKRLRRMTKLISIYAAKVEEGEEKKKRMRNSPHRIRRKSPNSSEFSRKKIYKCRGGGCG